MFEWSLINDNITDEDKKVMSDFILSSNRFTNGPKVKEFEEACRNGLGSASVMVGSGASANYITTAIVRELKGNGGEIIVPTIGWVSFISSVINTGFKPVFVDVDLDTMAIAHEAIRVAITEDTKAIVLVHALGFNGLNEEIIKLSKEKDLILIEDCCESHGATYKDSKIGTFGDMSCFSFYFGHHMTTIEGGMVCTDDEEIYQMARMFRSHGMTREASAEVQQKYFREDLNPLFTFAVAGFNMRSTELNAVLGLEQIKRLDQNIAARQKNLDIWLSNLDPEKFYVDFYVEGNSSFSLPLIIKSDQVSMSDVCELLERESVEYRTGTAGGGNQARQPYLEKHEYRVSGELKVSDFIHERGLYVGNHPELGEEQIINLCDELNGV